MISILQIEGQILDGVTFVQDYVQLQFGLNQLTIYSRIVILNGQTRLQYGQQGFADQLHALIGQKAVHVTDADDSVAITFESRAVVHFCADPRREGLDEAYEFVNADGEWLVAN